MEKSKNISQKCTDVILPIVTDLGYELVAVDYIKKNDGYNLTVFIDTTNPGGISLDDCEKVHRAIDGPLDALDSLFDSSYILNVSSCGLDWAFRTDRDYQKNLGQMVDVSLYSPIDKHKTYTGTLVNYSDTEVTITAKKQITLPRSAIAKICKHIDF